MFINELSPLLIMSEELRVRIMFLRVNKVFKLIMFQYVHHLKGK